MPSEQESQKGEKTSPRDLRFYAGIAIAAVGTCLAAYIMPDALKAYHWTVLIFAILMAAGFAWFLNMSDSDLAENVRLRFFLRSYLMAMVATLLAPTFLRGVLFMLDAKAADRLIGVFPIVAVFVAMTAAYVSSSNIQDVVVHRNARGVKDDVAKKVAEE